MSTVTDKATSKQKKAKAPKKAAVVAATSTDEPTPKSCLEKRNEDLEKASKADEKTLQKLKSEFTQLTEVSAPEIYMEISERIMNLESHVKDCNKEIERNKALIADPSALRDHMVKKFVESYTKKGRRC